MRMACVGDVFVVVETERGASSFRLLCEGRTHAHVARIDQRKSEAYDVCVRVLRNKRCVYVCECVCACVVRVYERCGFDVRSEKRMFTIGAHVCRRATPAVSYASDSPCTRRGKTRSEHGVCGVLYARASFG